MIDNSIKYGANKKFEKVHYMELVMHAMDTGKRYNDLWEALTGNVADYEGLNIQALVLER